MSIELLEIFVILSFLDGNRVFEVITQHRYRSCKYRRDILIANVTKKPAKIDSRERTDGVYSYENDRVNSTVPARLYFFRLHLKRKLFTGAQISCPVTTFYPSINVIVVSDNRTYFRDILLYHAERKVCKLYTRVLPIPAIVI